MDNSDNDTGKKQNWRNVSQKGLSNVVIVMFNCTKGSDVILQRIVVECHFGKIVQKNLSNYIHVNRLFT